MLRALRPLRLIQRNPGMRVIVSSLLKLYHLSTTSSGSSLPFLSVFALLGMQIFMGRPSVVHRSGDSDRGMRRSCSCSNESTTGRMLRGGGGDEGLEDGEAIGWVNPSYTTLTLWLCNEIALCNVDPRQGRSCIRYDGRDNKGSCACT